MAAAWRGDGVAWHSVGWRRRGVAWRGDGRRAAFPDSIGVRSAESFDADVAAIGFRLETVSLISRLGCGLGSRLGSRLGSGLGSGLVSRLGSGLGSRLSSGLGSRLGSRPFRFMNILPISSPGLMCTKLNTRNDPITALQSEPNLYNHEQHL